MLIKKKILVFTATYNEKDNIGKLVELIKRHCSFVHILIVDDNSPDNTADAVRFLQKKFENILLVERKSKLGLDTAHKIAYKYSLDNNYDYLITINYNVKKIPYNGSAIFLHLTNNYKPTAGCIALKKKDFEILLKLINQKTKIKIG